MALRGTLKFMEDNGLENLTIVQHYTVRLSLDKCKLSPFFSLHIRQNKVKIGAVGMNGNYA